MQIFCRFIFVATILSSFSASALELERPDSTTYPFAITGKTSPGTLVTLDVNGTRVGVKKADQNGLVRFDFPDGEIGELRVVAIAGSERAEITIFTTQTHDPVVRENTNTITTETPPIDQKKPDETITAESKDDNDFGTAGRIAMQVTVGLMVGATVIPGIGAFTNYDFKHIAMQIGMNLPIPIMVHLSGDWFGGKPSTWWFTTFGGYLLGSAFLIGTYVDNSSLILLTPLVTLVSSIAFYEVGRGFKKRTKKPAVTVAGSPFGLVVRF